MTLEKIKVGSFEIGNELPLTIIGGLNVLEDYDLAARTCEKFMQVCEKYGLNYVFKASFDKANRSSNHSYRGPGLDAGMLIFKRLKQEFNVPIITDVHEPYQCKEVAPYVDILQLPAFLARQTDLVNAMAVTGKPINVKKPQFMAPAQVTNVIEKFEEANNNQIMICERGSQFGYDNLVVDMLGFGVMKKVSNNAPLVFDVTHSLQCRAADAKASGGRRSQSLELAKSGVALKIAALFLEAHPDPAQAKCDGPSALPLDLLEPFIAQIAELDKLIKSQANLVIE
ncbi:MAG: 3-deoxy-8-phosphooctulonate synthase [Anaerobiospirillum succiniciproducens]|uniref:3-deoxy-8-phosphooctulonate synthase n=1 Tax=Anaerobiospirillum succiniciproducens TaxID=13335 RepID=UPI0026DCB54C|nr:3-deoxy-8-phosphooctulonate synthase [Anaerobiospirillum succiniciproducens]MDO4676236.1 3-deoxy-8-phosphooctulonate synthase [Anaerobiospirillum succiniciproducens]